MIPLFKLQVVLVIEVITGAIGAPLFSMISKTSETASQSPLLA